MATLFVLHKPLVLPGSWRRHVGAQRLIRRTVRHSAVVVRATAETTVSERARPGEKKGFVEEMRFVAMRLHTKDQAPKEGGKEASKTPLAAWKPTLQGYLQFLTESKVVYDKLEKIMSDATHPDYANFQNTGLERSAALAKDIEWMQNTYEMVAVEPQEDGPGLTYARLLDDLAANDPPAFICHYYNVYFAHTAGGKMIGAKVSGMLLEGKELEFYKYDGDLKELLQAVRDALNAVAGSWTREQKDRCLEETEKSFQYSGGLLRLIFGGDAAH